MSASTEAMDEFEDAEHKPAFYTVAIFLVDRAYGGPEEGGWWYDHGHPAEYIPDGINPHDLMTVFTVGDEHHAREWITALQLQLDAGPNKQRRSDIGSVLSEGCWRAVLCDGWPRAYPETTPHYE